MRICGIVSEYNPFHRGHAYHIEQSRRLTGADIVVSVMSGSFVQRGEPAVFDKWTRAACAIAGGADAVIELPLLSAIQSAEGFASGGVRQLAAAGITDLCFGCETDDMELLCSIADTVADEDDDFKLQLSQRLSEGHSFARARAGAAGMPDIASLPGAILGVEYLKAIRRGFPHIAPHVVLRQGAGYHSDDINAHLPSATAIRKALAQGLTEQALAAMKADGVKRAVAFTQYPQFSCATTGSSLNELWRAARRLGLQRDFEWSVIDRWFAHPRFVEAMTETVRAGLDGFASEERDDVLIVFSAHSLPMSVVNRGDAYPAEVGATVHAVMERLGYAHEYLISYQSEVGPVPWLGPSTESVVRELGAKKRRNVLVVPVAFTSDHIETLHELDIEYGELAAEVGITKYVRAPALNDLPVFQDALAGIVAEHLRSGEPCSLQYGLRCPGCVNPQCRDIPRPVAPYKRTNVSADPKNKQYAP